MTLLLPTHTTPPKPWTAEDDDPFRSDLQSVDDVEREFWEWEEARELERKQNSVPPAPNSGEENQSMEVDVIVSRPYTVVEHERGIREGQVVFVDPLDSNALYWWIAMVVPKEEVDPSMSPARLAPDEVVVRYFEDCHYSTLNVSELLPFMPASGLYERFVQYPEFTNSKGYRRVTEFLATGRAPKSFKWKSWGTSGKYRAAAEDVPEPSELSGSINNGRMSSQRREPGSRIQLQTAPTRGRPRQSTPISSGLNPNRQNTSPTERSNKRTSPADSPPEGDSGSYRLRTSARLEHYKQYALERQLHPTIPPPPPTSEPTFSHLLTQIFADMNQLEADGSLKRAPTPPLVPMKRSGQRPIARKQISSIIHPNDILSTATPRVMFHDPYRPSAPLPEDTRSRLLATLASRIKEGASNYQRINNLIRIVPRRRGTDRNLVIHDLSSQVDVTRQMIQRWGREDKGEVNVDESRVVVEGGKLKRSAPGMVERVGIGSKKAKTK